MMQIADLINPNTNPLPEEVQELVAALLEGRVKSMFLVAELVDHDGQPSWIEGCDLNMDDHESDQRAFVGAVTITLDELKQDLLDGAYLDEVMDDDEDPHPGLDNAEDDD